MNNDRPQNLMRDLGIIALGIVIAVILVKTGAIEDLLTSSQEAKIIGSFVAGVFFVSVFTAAPATAAFIEIAQSNSVLWMAFFGGLGALLGDLIIFRFVKDRLSEHFFYLIRKTKFERFGTIFKLRLFHWLIPFVGALIIASPLPDEVGIVMMGLSKTRTSLFIPISFLLNSLGILAIGLIAK